MKKYIFALYAGDNYIDSGTAKELAKKIDVLPEHIRYLSTPAHQRKLARSKRPNGRAKYTIKLGLDDSTPPELQEMKEMK